MLHPKFPADVYLEGMTTRCPPLCAYLAAAVLNGLERLAKAATAPTASVSSKTSCIAESQLRPAGKPFLHDAYLSELTGLRDQLKTGLSGATPGARRGEAGPGVSELSEQIKALKAAQHQAMPQRDGSIPPSRNRSPPAFVGEMGQFPYPIS